VITRRVVQRGMRGGGKSPRPLSKLEENAKGVKDHLRKLKVTDRSSFAVDEKESEPWEGGYDKGEK